MFTLLRVASLAVVGLLLWTAPVWAVAYTGSASLDWGSLTFSGVSVELIPRSQQQWASLLSGNWGPSFAGTGNPPATFTKVEDGFSITTGWVEQTITSTLPQVGSVSASSDAQTLSSSISMDGAAFGQSFVDRNAFLMATESGLLTVSINYSVSHTDVPQTSGAPPDFWAKSWTELFVADHTGANQVMIGELDARTGSSSQTGILSVTQWLTAGMAGYFTVATSSDVGRPVADVVSAPEPPTVWLMLLGFVGLAWWMAWGRSTR